MNKKSKEKKIVNCAYCSKVIKDGEGIYHPFWYHLNGHVYCNKNCSDRYLSTK